MGLRGAGARWLSKKREEIKTKRAEEKARREEFEAIKREELKKAYRTEVKHEAIRQARVEAKGKVKKSFSKPPGISGMLKSELRGMAKTVANSPVGSGEFAFGNTLTAGNKKKKKKQSRPFEAWKL